MARIFSGEPFRDIGSFKSSLPRQFNEATNRTIELIDVLWLQGDAIIAAFEWNTPVQSILGC